MKIALMVLLAVVLGIAALGVSMMLHSEEARAGATTFSEATVVMRGTVDGVSVAETYKVVLEIDQTTNTIVGVLPKPPEQLLWPIQHWIIIWWPIIHYWWPVDIVGGGFDIPFMQAISPEGFVETFEMKGGDEMVMTGKVKFNLRKSKIRYRFEARGLPVDQLNQQETMNFDLALPTVDAFNFQSKRPGRLRSNGKTVMWSTDQGPMVVDVTGRVRLNNPEGELPTGVDMIGVTTFTPDAATGGVRFESRVAIAKE